MTQTIVGDMARLTEAGIMKGAAIAAVVGLLAMAGALALYSIDQRNTADFVRTVYLQGQPPPDTSSYDSLSAGSLTEAVIALVMAAVAWPLRGRILFMVVAIWSVLAVGTGAWIALETTPGLESVSVGPVELSMTVVGGLLAAAAVMSLSASVAGWIVSPSWAPPKCSYMPPETHQA